MYNVHFSHYSVVKVKLKLYQIYLAMYISNSAISEISINPKENKL